MTYWGIVSLMVIFGNFGQCWCVLQTTFSLMYLCDVQDRISKGCFEIVNKARDHLECFTTCGWDNLCLGTLISGSSSSCYQQRACTYSRSCTSPDPSFRYYIKGSAKVGTTTTSPTTIQHTSTPDTPTSTSTTTATTTTTTTTTTSTTTTTTPTTTTSMTTVPPFCQHSGVQTSTTTCDCSGTDGWVGNRCERRPHSCRELSTFGYSSGTRIYPIDIHRNNSRPVNTACTVGSSSDDVGLLKHTGTQNYGRNWDDYLDGFFYDADNYWLGLDNIYAYNKKGFTRIGIELVFQSPSVSGKVIQEYYSFRMSDNSSGYTYTVGSGASASRSVSGNGNTRAYDLSDPFYPCQNIPFSTFDKDQDLEPHKNCADLTGTGWWFKTCTPEPIVSPLGSSVAANDFQRVILPKYDTMSSGPREAFKYVYVYLKP